MRFAFQDLDELYEEQVSPLLINEIPYVTEQDRERLSKIIMTTYDNTDVLSPVPTCLCGYLTSGIHQGKTCHLCNSIVEIQNHSALDVKVWIRKPEGINAFVHPYVWALLSLKFNKNNSKNGDEGKFNLLAWMTNPTYKVTNGITKINEQRKQLLISRGWKRSINFFIENFDFFIDILPELMGKNSIEIEELQIYLRYNKNRIFSNYLPIPTKTLIVLEKTPVKQFADLSISGITEAVKTIATIANSQTPYKQSKLESLIANVQEGMNEYYCNTLTKTLCPKGGGFRLMFKTRSHFTARGVITPIIGSHDYEELHIPWSQGVELLKVHIVSKLLKLDYNLAVYERVELAVAKYDPLIDKIMQEIIYESHFPKLTNPDFRGLPCVFQRNPSLVPLSAQVRFITKVKPDIFDRTFSQSNLGLKGKNSDYDGDNENLTLLPYKRLSKVMMNMRMHHRFDDVSKPLKISGFMNLPDNTIMTIANYVNRTYGNKK